MGRTLGMAAAMALLLMLSIGGVVEAGARVERQITLSATAAGSAIDASGVARVRQDRNRQNVKVSMDARVADGTVFSVYVTNTSSPGSFLAGQILIVAGRGELQLSNANGATLPAGVSPVDEIQTVSVANGAGDIVLSGSF